MAQRVALCVDESACRNPELMGLDGETLGSQEWLSVFSRGGEARRGIGGNRNIELAWVVSCDDVEPINLAASIKSDRPEVRVSLVTTEGCGSLFSRAHTANIDEVIQRNAFVRNYAEAKGRLADVRDHEARADQPVMPSSIPLEERAPSIGQSMLGESGSVGLMEKPRIDASSPEHAVQLMANPLRTPAKSPGRAFVLTVVSGSGGAGKSSVSVMSALVASQMGYRTLLLDYDLQFGDVASMAGVEDPLGIDTALAHPDRLERELRRDRMLTVLAAPERIEMAEEVVRGLPALLESLSGRFDVIVANTGAAWAEQHAALLERSSVALFLIDQRASSLRACKHALDLCARCGIATNPFKYAVNRCSKGAPLSAIDVSCALQGAPTLEIKDGGRDVEDCLGSGAATELLEMKNDFAKSVEQIMVRLLPQEEPGSSGDGNGGVGLIQRRRGRHSGRRRGRRLS